MTRARRSVRAVFAGSSSLTLTRQVAVHVAVTETVAPRRRTPVAPRPSAWGAGGAGVVVAGGGAGGGGGAAANGRRWVSHSDGGPGIAAFRGSTRHRHAGWQ